MATKMQSWWWDQAAFKCLSRHRCLITLCSSVIRRSDALKALLACCVPPEWGQIRALADGHQSITGHGHTHTHKHTEGQYACTVSYTVLLVCALKTKVIAWFHLCFALVIMFPTTAKKWITCDFLLWEHTHSCTLKGTPSTSKRSISKSTPMVAL